MRSFSADERRSRLARRHRLAPEAQASTVADAARSLVCLHATDPATVYLSAWARVHGLTIDDVQQALYGERSLIKHLAMRRTLFVFPRDTLAAAHAGASGRVAATERARLARDVEAAGLRRDGGRWLTQVSKQVLAALADGREATSSGLRDELPLMAGAIAYGEGKAWAGRSAVGPRVLTVLSAAGAIVRASNDGGWTASRPRWMLMSAWLGEPMAAMSEQEGLTRMVALWLRAFGPGTEQDIKWWLGSTLTAVRRALTELHAVTVDLEGRPGYLLPDDLAEEAPVKPWAALLPMLDPTTMGWFEREWYLGPHRAQLFDTSGNAGPTIWWNGRIVGGWRQNARGEVQLQLLEPVSRTAQRAIAREADRLTAWLAGTRVLPRFPSPLWKAIDTDAGQI